MSRGWYHASLCPTPVRGAQLLLTRPCRSWAVMLGKGTDASAPRAWRRCIYRLRRSSTMVWTKLHWVLAQTALPICSVLLVRVRGALAHGDRHPRCWNPRPPSLDRQVPCYCCRHLPMRSSQRREWHAWLRSANLASGVPRWKVQLRPRYAAVGPRTPTKEKCRPMIGRLGWFHLVYITPGRRSLLVSGEFPSPISRGRLDISGTERCQKHPALLACPCPSSPYPIP